MKNILKLIGSITLCELVGLAGTPFTLAAIPSWYSTLEKPFFAPPNWVFGPTWTVLYFLMGVSWFLVWKQGWGKKKVQAAGRYFLAQLSLNFIWSPVFFGLRSPELGLIVIVALWLAILMTIKRFHPVSKIAAYLLIPYLLWVSFATLLNAAVAVLN